MSRFIILIRYLLLFQDRFIKFHVCLEGDKDCIVHSLEKMVHRPYSFVCKVVCHFRKETQLYHVRSRRNGATDTRTAAIL